MPGTMDLVGGMLNGFVGTKNQAQQAQSMNEYRKAMTDHVKTQAKLEEQKINLSAMKDQFMQQILGNALSQPGQSAPMPMNQPNVPPVAQVQPSLPDQIAQGQMPISPGGVTIPGDPSNNISVRQNNPFNIKGGANYPGSIGEGTRGFSIFPSADVGYAAGLDLVRKYQSGNGPVPAGTSINDMGAKYEGTANYPNWVKNVSNYLGTSPDTPIANIPTMKLAAAVANAESSTKPPAQYYAQPQSQAQPSAAQPTTQPGQRLITQKDALGAAWKYFTGADLKDEKYDYRMTPQKDIAVMKDGNLIKIVPTGPNIELKELPNGDMVFIDTKAQAITKVIPTPPKMDKQTGTAADGTPYVFYTPQPKYPNQGEGGLPSSPSNIFQPPGSTLPPGAIPTGPAAKDMIKTVPEAINQKITTEYDPMIAQLGYLKDNYVGPKGEDKNKVFGLKNQLKFDAAENKWVRQGMETVGIPVTDDLIDFHKTMKRLENFEVHNFGGANLTATELKRALGQIPRTNNPKDFATAVDAAMRAYKAYKDSIYDFYSKSENQRTNEALSTPTSPAPSKKPSLNLGKTPSAPNYRYNPASGKLEAVQ